MTGASHNHEQPGLEVVDSRPQPGLELALPSSNWLHSVQVEDGNHKEPFISTYKAEEHIDQPLPAKKRNTKKIILVAAGCLVIIIAIVVGVVVGVVVKPGSDTTSTSNSQSDTANDTATVDENTGPSEAEMTGSPTSVAPGLAPTAISWGYPHLEIFALTNNDTSSVYRKYRNENATSETDFLPGGSEMELVGGGIDTNLAPSIAVNHRIADKSQNRTEIHINGKRSGYRKFHDENQIWSGEGDPTHWDGFGDIELISAPVEVQYEPTIEQMKVFYLSKGDSGLAAQYFQYFPEDGWSNLIQVEGPDLQPMTPAVVAWNSDDTRLDLFAVSRANSHLLHATYASETSKWSDYEDLEGFITTSPVALSRTPGTLDVFARGGDAGLWYISYNDEKWANWTRISGETKIQGAPDAISVDEDSLDVFAWGEDGSMLYKSFDVTSKTWEPEVGFQVVGDDKLSGPPKAMSDGPGRVNVFAYNEDNELIWQKFRGAAEDNWSLSSLADVPMVN